MDSRFAHDSSELTNTGNRLRALQALLIIFVYVSLVFFNAVRLHLSSLIDQFMR